MLLSHFKSPSRVASCRSATSSRMWLTPLPAGGSRERKQGAAAAGGGVTHTPRGMRGGEHIYIWRILDRWRWSRGQGRPGGGGRGADDVGVCELRCRLQDCGPGIWGDEKGRMGKEDGAWEQAMGEAWQPPANPSSLVELQGKNPSYKGGWVRPL